MTDEPLPRDMRSRRTCKYCGTRYVVPKWSKAEDCPECAPRLFSSTTSFGREPAGVYTDDRHKLPSPTSAAP